MRQSFKPMTFRLAHSWRDLRLSDQSLCHSGIQYSGVAYRVVQYHYLATLPRAGVLKAMGSYFSPSQKLGCSLSAAAGHTPQIQEVMGSALARSEWLLLFLFHSPLTITMWEFLMLIKNAEWVSLILASATAHIFVCDHRPKLRISMNKELFELLFLLLFTIWFISSLKEI